LFILTPTSTPPIYTLSLHDALPIYLLKIDFRISKCRQAFRLRRLERGPELTCFADLTHSLTATTGSRLEHHRVSKLFGGCACRLDRKSTRLNSSHVAISYAVFCLKK